jgi:biopolymer transport protein ExbD
MVQGEAVVSTATLLDERVGTVHEVTDRLRQLEQNLPKSIADNKEITLLADKTIPFKVLKKIMTTCTASGYGRISLAVEQKAVKG